MLSTDDRMFLAAVGQVLREEGGYVNDPNDSGGETNFGISAASNPGVDIKNLTVEQATSIYYSKYWQPFHFDRLPWPLAGKVFDLGVNMGPQAAIRILQQCLSLPMDGIIGPQVESRAANAMPSIEERYVDAVEAHYQHIAEYTPQDAKFLRGWLRRATAAEPELASPA